MDLQRFNDKYIGIRSDIKQNKRTVYRKIETKIMEEKIILKLNDSILSDHIQI